MVIKASRANGFWAHCLRRVRDADRRQKMENSEARTPSCRPAPCSFRVLCRPWGLNADRGNLYWAVKSPHVLHSSLNPVKELPVFQNDLEPLILLPPPSQCWQHHVQLVKLFLLHVGSPHVCTAFEFGCILFEIFDPWRDCFVLLLESTTNLP